MSQVLKAQEGAKVPEQAKLFKDGERTVSLNLIAKNAQSNLGSYLESKSWNKRKQEAFLQAYSDIISNINNGNISQRDNARMWVDSTGRITNSKKRGFDAYGEAAHYLDTIVDAMEDYDGKPRSLGTYNNSNLVKMFSNEYFGGNEPDLQIWSDFDPVDKKTGKRGVSNRVIKFTKLLQDYQADLANKNYDFANTAYKDKNDLLNRINAAITSLNDGTFNNNDYASLAAIGINGEQARALFQQDTQSQDQGDTENANSGNAEQGGSAETGGDSTQAIKDLLTKEYIDPANNIQARTITLPKATLDTRAKSIMAKTVQDPTTFFNNFANLLTTYSPIDNKNLSVWSGFYNRTGKRSMSNYLQHIANNLSYLGADGGVDIGNGWVMLPYSISSKRGTVLLYNPKANTLKEEAVFRVPQAWQYVQEQALQKSQQQSNPWIPGLGGQQPQQQDAVPSQKKGGTLKLQSGGYFDNVDLTSLGQSYIDARNQEFQAEQLAKRKKAQKEENKAKAAGMTPEQYKAAQHKPFEKGAESLTGTDIADLTSIGLDLGSMMASFVPGYGTAASAITGALSSLTQFGADVARDGLDWGDAGRLAGNLGMDAMGALPSGQAVKAGKIAKTLYKFVPKILKVVRLAGIYGGIQNSPQIIQSFGKLSNPSDMTVQDWGNIAQGVKLTVTGGRYLKQKSDAAKFKKEAPETGNTRITLSNGKKTTVTADQLAELRKAKTTTEANKTLQSFKGHENDKLNKNFNTKGWNFYKRTPIIGQRFIPKTEAERSFGPEFNEYKTIFGIKVPTNRTLWRLQQNGEIDSTKVKATQESNPKTNAEPESSTTGGLPVPSDYFIKNSDGTVTRNPKYDFKPYTKEDEEVYNIAKQQVDEINNANRADRSKVLSKISEIGNPKEFEDRINRPIIEKTQQAEAADRDAVEQARQQIIENLQKKPKGELKGAARKAKEDLYANIFAKQLNDEDVYRVYIKNQNDQPLIDLIERYKTEAPLMRQQRELYNSQRSAQEAADNVNRMISVTIANMKPKAPLTGGARAAKENMYNTLWGKKAVNPYGKQSTRYKRNMRKGKVAKYMQSDKKGGVINYLKYLREGGVLKFQAGGSTDWYSGLTDYDPNKYKYNYDTSTLVNGDMSDTNFNAWTSNRNGLGKGRYMPALGNSYDYTKGVEGQPYYQKFGNDLLDQNGNFTEVGKQWAKAVDAHLPTDSLATFYDQNGNLRSSWQAKNQDQYHRQAQSFNNLRDYVNYVRNDQILGARHNVFLNKGNRYFYKDAKGVQHWVDPSVISDYNVSKTPVQSWNPDHTIYWSDYELTGKKVEPSKTVGDTKPEKQGINWPGVLDQAKGELLPFGRLIGNIWNNNRVTKETLKGINPFLQDTYNLQRWVRGDLATKQAYYGQAAQLENLAAQPRTSDASLQLAGQLSANMKGNQLRAQGDLADNNMINETAEKALQLQFDNTARRSAVANQNRKALIDADKARHDIEAARMTANWTSVENYLKGLENKFNQSQDQRRNLAYQAKLLDINTKYDNGSLDALKSRIKDMVANDKDNTPEYAALVTKYNAMAKKIGLERSQDMLNAQAEVYGFPHFNFLKAPWTPTDIQSTPSKKSGGTIEAARIRARIENQKLFQKNIEAAVKHNEKMLNNLSSITKQLILKSMGAK